MIKEIRLQNHGVLTTQVPQDILSNITDDINKLNNSSNFVKHLQAANTTLVGQIEEEYNFTPKNEFIDFLNSFYKNYCDHFSLEYKKPYHKDIWVNLQKQTEYNPAHYHPNCLMSWVLWVKIPYNFSDENSIPSSIRANAKFNGKFTFIFSELNGSINIKPIDEEFYREGSIILFPSFLYHNVYPFYTSNELRISLAGNFIHGN